MSSSPTPDAIRTLREKAELTQTDAAALVHSGLRTWQQWEAGDRRIAPWSMGAFRLKTTLIERPKTGINQ